ncbi:MAG: site-specific integrase [Oceanicaulis sp.]
MSGAPPARIHRVSKILSGGERRWFYYAWRGGPRFWTCDGAPVDYARPPEGFGAALDAARAEGRQTAAGRTGARTVSALIDRYRRSGDFARLSEATKETYGVYFAQIEAEFGDDAVIAFDDPEIVDDILAWRDEKAAAGQLRAADHRVRVLARLLSFARLLKWCAHNPAQGVPRLYDADRSEIVFSRAERALIFEGGPAADPETGQVRQVAPAEPHLAAIFTLAFYTGARRADLAAMPLSADHGLELVWRTSKSRGRTEAIVPVLPPLRALIDARRAQAQAAAPAEKTRIAATTILTTSRGRPWTRRGLSDAVAKRLAECAITGKHLHDSRGTFATELCEAGFSNADIAEFCGWSGDEKKVARIRARYVNRAALARQRIKRWNDGKR